ncbi:hypothetical protein CLU79DRAFT_756060 [Phycomyces nitens]|nr:hypothetical protein CLU79DRAFT_756060 [Phycomyces nitens]
MVSNADFQRTDLATERVSLLHKNPLNQDSSIVIHTHTWHIGTTENTVLFDTASFTGSQLHVMIALSQAYPNAIKILEHKIDRRKHLELVLDNTLDADRACLQGFEFQSKRVIGIKSVDPQAKIVKLHLSNLPSYEDYELLEIFYTNLSMFGKVLDVGIYHEPKTSTYMGTGFAVLDLQQDDCPESQPFTPLTRVIKFPPDPAPIRITWNNISQDCDYCHEADHTYKHCPTQPKKSIFCWNCLKTGHLQKDCWGKPAKDAERMKHEARLAASAKHARKRDNETQKKKEKLLVYELANMKISDTNKTSGKDHHAKENLRLEGLPGDMESACQALTLGEHEQSAIKGTRLFSKDEINMDGDSFITHFCDNEDITVSFPDINDKAEKVPWSSEDASPVPWVGLLGVKSIEKTLLSDQHTNATPHQKLVEPLKDSLESSKCNHTSPPVWIALDDKSSNKQQNKGPTQPSLDIQKPLKGKRKDWRSRLLSQLQSRRNKLLRSRPPPTILDLHLPGLDSQISSLRAEIAQRNGPKTAKYWTENGEPTSEYLEMLVTPQERQHGILEIKPSSE